VPGVTPDFRRGGRTGCSTVRPDLEALIDASRVGSGPLIAPVGPFAVPAGTVVTSETMATRP